MKLHLVFLLGPLGVMSMSMAVAGGDGFTFMGTSEDGLVGKNSYNHCVEKAMHKLEPQRVIVPGKEFQDALFPYFEPETAPKSVPELTDLLTRPVVQQRVETMGVRYVAVILGNSGTSGNSGPFFCGWWAGFGGCGGVSTSEERTYISVALWDLQVPQASTETAGSDTGKNVMLGLILPIPILTDTKNPACADAARKILEAIKAGG